MRDVVCGEQVRRHHVRTGANVAQLPPCTFLPDLRSPILSHFKMSVAGVYAALESFRLLLRLFFQSHGKQELQQRVRSHIPTHSPLTCETLNSMEVIFTVIFRYNESQNPVDGSNSLQIAAQMRP